MQAIATGHVHNKQLLSETAPDWIQDFEYPKTPTLTSERAMAHHGPGKLPSPAMGFNF